MNWTAARFGNPDVLPEMVLAHRTARHDGRQYEASGRDATHATSSTRVTPFRHRKSEHCLSPRTPAPGGRRPSGSQHGAPRVHPHPIPLLPRNRTRRPRDLELAELDDAFFIASAMARSDGRAHRHSPCYHVWQARGSGNFSDIRSRKPRSRRKPRRLSTTMILRLRSPSKSSSSSSVTTPRHCRLRRRRTDASRRANRP